MGENPCVKRKNQENVCTFPYALTFHLPSCCEERRDILIIHPSTFSVYFFSSFAHAQLIIYISLKMWGSILIIIDSIMCMCDIRSSCFAEPCFLLFCLPILYNHVLFCVVRLFYRTVFYSVLFSYC